MLGEWRCNKGANIWYYVVNGLTRIVIFPRSDNKWAAYPHWSAHANPSHAILYDSLEAAKVASLMRYYA